MRNKKLIRERDKAIVEEFFKLHDQQRMRMDDALEKLSKEHFYLDANYIYSRIFYNRENNDYYNSLCEQEKRNN